MIAAMNGNIEYNAGRTDHKKLWSGTIERPFTSSMYTSKSAHMFVSEIFMTRSKIRNYEDNMYINITFAMAGQH